MKLGLDYSSPIPPSGAAVRTGGYSFVCRYLSWLGNWKNLKPEEIIDMQANSVAVVVVFETTKYRAAEGHEAGRYDAGEAILQARALGWPADRPIYFAVDFDTAELETKSIAEYFRGVRYVLGEDRVGVYGGYDAVKTLLDAGLVKYAWQTTAWSRGQREPRINLFQRLEQVTVDGVTCDVDEALTTDYGQWPLEDDMPSIDEVRTVVREELRSLFEGSHPDSEIEPGRNPFDVLLQTKWNTDALVKKLGA